MFPHGTVNALSTKSVAPMGRNPMMYPGQPMIRDITIGRNDIAKIFCRREDWHWLAEHVLPKIRFQSAGKYGAPFPMIAPPGNPMAEREYISRGHLDQCTAMLTNSLRVKSTEHESLTKGSANSPMLTQSHLMGTSRGTDIKFENLGSPLPDGTAAL